MNLCHQEDIQKLTTQELFQQHNYICYLRGDGWQKEQHYVFGYPYLYLYAFHMHVIKEIEQRGYSVDPLWKDSCFNGARRLQHKLKTPPYMGQIRRIRRHLREHKFDGGRALEKRDAPLRFYCKRLA